MALIYDGTNVYIVLGCIWAFESAVPDELSEEASGITNDASRPGLLVLAKLQSQPIIHMALKRQDSLHTS